MPSDRRERSLSGGSAHSSRSQRAGGAMGPDGGEAGRRIAAEDEYIRRELTETTFFCNAFWGQNDAGFEVISSRMKASQRTLDELKSLYKERADIEAEYAKRLAKLSKQVLGYSETGALKAAFDVVKAELDATSRTHNDLASMIKKDLEGAVVDFANKSWNARKAAQANIEKLHKQKQTQESYVNKSREKYEQDCIKINGYTAQSSLVQGKDLDKVAHKLDKAQATVSQNDRDYQNFVRALKVTTVKWNVEWKAYLDQCQDQEEERIDFTKGNLWNFANAVSAVCVADDESCERIRVSLENVDTPRDVQFFIQYCGTGSLIPAPPEYINYAKGQAPPSRPTYHTAKFQRNTTRPPQLPIPQQPPQQQQQPSPQQQQQHAAAMHHSQSQDMSQSMPSQPTASASVPAPRNGYYQDKPVPPQPTTQTSDLPSQHYEQDASQALPSAQPGVPAPAPAIAQSSSRPATGAPVGSTVPSSQAAPAAGIADDEDPIAKALASLRMRPGAKSPNLGRRESLSAEPQPPVPFAQPGQIVQNMPPQHRAHSPSPSMASNMPPRARSPTPAAAFMQAPARAPSPLPVEDVVGQYGQSFPGERKSLSRQNSVASRAGVQSSAPENPRSPAKQEQGFAGVGARDRSPNPQPWSQPTIQQQQAAASPRVPATSSDQPKTGTLTRKQSNIPPRSTTPLGISLDATGSVTHDQMAVDYIRKTGNVAPQQQQAPAAAPAQTQQPARPPSVVYQQQVPHHQAHLSVSSQFSTVPGQAPPLQSPYAYQGQHGAQPSVYSTVGQQAPAAQQQQQYAGYAQSAYGQGHQPAAPSQSVPAHLAQHQQAPSQYAGSPAPAPSAQSPYPAQQPAAAQQAPPAGYYGHPGRAPAVQQQPTAPYTSQETPAAAYMHEYLQQQQQQQAAGPNGVSHASQPSTASMAPQHYQQQQQWARTTSPAPAPASAPAPAAAAAGAPPAGQLPFSPTGQYNDAGHPILFYVKALYDYQATNPDEFSFTTGDIIAVTHTEADGWWQGELLDEARRKVGANTFPSNFVALLQ